MVDDSSPYKLSWLDPLRGKLENIPIQLPPKRIKPTMENNHIIATFLQACRNPLFQHRWMAAETWSELINDHYRIAPSLRFSGESLLKAVSRCKWLNNLVNTGVINDSISLFRNNYRPKGSKNCYCFYAAPKGEKPTAENATATWYLNISKELLSTKVTRSSSLMLDLKLPNKNLTTNGRVAKKKSLRPI